MLTSEFRLDRAEACEHRADDCADPGQRLEWLRMANEWRLAAEPPRPPPVESVGGPTHPRTAP